MNNKILEQYGFHFPQSGIATNAAEAVRIASKIGFPVAMKISSPDILHKVDVGGVRLGLYTPDQVQTVFAEILENIRFQAPKALINGVQLEEMCSGGIEIFIGLINDIQFGPSITFGLGGTLIEMLNDVSYRVLPIERADAESMLNEIKARKILDGYRGLPNVSHPMLVD